MAVPGPADNRICLQCRESCATRARFCPRCGASLPPISAADAGSSDDTLILEPSGRAADDTAELEPARGSPDDTITIQPVDGGSPFPAGPARQPLPEITPSSRPSGRVGRAPGPAAQGRLSLRLFGLSLGVLVLLLLAGALLLDRENQ